MAEIFTRQQFTVSGTPAQSAVFDLPDRVDTFRVRIDRPKTERTVNWTRSQHICVAVFLSLDGGTTWEFVTGYTTQGGVFVDRLGTEEDQNVHFCQLDPRDPRRSATGRKIKVSFAALDGGAPELTVDFEAGEGGVQIARVR